MDYSKFIENMKTIVECQDSSKVGRFLDFLFSDENVITKKLQKNGKITLPEIEIDASDFNCAFMNVALKIYWEQSSINRSDIIFLMTLFKMSEEYKND